MNGLPGEKRCFPDLGAIDISAVGRPEVFDEYIALIDNDLAMRTGNWRIIDLEIIGEPPAEKVRSRLELDFPRCGGTGVNNEFRHGWALGLPVNYQKGATIVDINFWLRFSRGVCGYRSAGRPAPQRLRIRWKFLIFSGDSAYRRAAGRDGPRSDGVSRYAG